MVTKSSIVDIEDDALISIVGHEHKYPYGKVKSAVIPLGGAFYFKDDDTNLVKIKDGDKYKLYRKKSRLIVLLPTGKYALRANCITTDDGLVLDVKNGDAVKLHNGKYVKKDYAVKIGDAYYLMSDPSIVKCYISGTQILRKDAIELDPDMYGKRVVKELYRNELVVDDTTGKFITRDDVSNVMAADGSIKSIHRNRVDMNAGYRNIFHKFRDATNPQLDRIDQIRISYKDFKAHAKHVHEATGIDLWVHENHLEEFMRVYTHQILVARAQLAAELKAALVYDDDGPDENMATNVTKGVTYPGKHKIYVPQTKSIVKAKTFAKTGGLRYTYGVEIETSHGMLPNKLAEKYGTSIVGDRSIGSGEYVTAPLQGDIGLEILEGLCGALSQHTYVDNRCGIHVHTKGESEFDGRHFATNAIKLGYQVEPELYASCPPSRAPQLKHCHSIMRYKDINESNWKQYLSAYVFGKEENWNKPFSFAPYSYGSPGQNKEHRITDNWTGGRYKWMNLLHVLSASSIGTFELRMFPGSTNFHKIYMYVLTTLAFTWFVENRAGLIHKGNVKLKDVLTEPFLAHNHPEIAQLLLDFYQERTARFNRDMKTMYPEVIPPAIF
jgi:hypothetical protein